MYTLASIAFAAMSSLAAIFFVDTVTPQTLHLLYRDAGINGRPVRILVMPGHEPKSGGTGFATYLERDLNVDIASRVVEKLSSDPKITATLGRTTTTWYAPLDDYLSKNKSQIATWREQQIAVMDSAVKNGTVQLTNGVGHTNATPSARIKLYGINKWAGENQYDIVLSLHFNDYAGRKAGRIGTYKGYAIYVPNRQFSNSTAAKELGARIETELKKVQQKSTLKGESSGLVEDQELIAIGANNSSDTANVLIEYGYIYETQFLTKKARDATFAVYADATAQGIRAYLAGK